MSLSVWIIVWLSVGNVTLVFAANGLTRRGRPVGLLASLLTVALWPVVWLVAIILVVRGREQSEEQAKPGAGVQDDAGRVADTPKPKSKAYH